MPQHRSPGQRAGVTPALILDVARNHNPRTLTLQTIADQIGVDRKAIVYHVKDKDELLGLLAADSFQTSFAARQSFTDTHWTQALHSFARVVLESLKESGLLAAHFRWTDTAAQNCLEHAETVLERMSDAGFRLETSTRALDLIARMVVGHVHRLAYLNGDNAEVLSQQIENLLARNPEERLELVREANQQRENAGETEQFEFMMRTIIAGLERLKEEASEA